MALSMQIAHQSLVNEVSALGTGTHMAPKQYF